MMNKTHHKRRGGQSGNIFFMLFASVALVGAFGVGASNVMKGLVASMSDVTRKTIAEEKMTSGARISVQGATAVSGGDCDTDGMVEPLPYTAISGSFDIATHTHPVNGGYLPENIGITQNDPWGTPYGYCVWDPGPVTVSDAVVGCGGATPRRLQGRRADPATVPEAETDIVIAVISAGKDRRFTTRCNAYVDTTPANGVADTPLVQIPDGGDDLVLEYSYRDVNGLSGDDLWRIRDTKPDTASIDKEISIGGNATMDGVLELRRRGLLLPTDADTLACTSTGPLNNDAELRINASSSPPVLEICYNNAWSPISMANGGGGGGGGTCTATNWVETPTGLNVGGTWWAGAYGAGLYVVVGSWPDYIMTSPDGVTWTKRTSASPTWENIRGVVYANNQFVAVTEGNTIDGVMTSTDGITWTSRVSAAANEWQAITYGEGLYVAVSNDGANRAMSSPDGITWTSHPTPARDWHSVAYGNGQFVAISESGHVMSSPDGITWTQVASGVANARIVFGNGLFVITGSDTIMTSPDGVTWTNQTIPLGEWFGITYISSGLFVVTAWSDYWGLGNWAMTSPDAVTWTLQTTPSFSTWNIVGGPAGLVASGYDGRAMFSACDGGAGTPDDEPVISVPDPVVHLRLDEQTGTNIIDSRNNVTSTLTGASVPPTVTGTIGRAIDLDGTDDRILITGNSSINNLSQFTVSFWTYGISAAPARNLVNSRNAGDNGFILARNTDSTLSLTLGTLGSFTTVGTVPDNAWTHVTLTYDSLNLTQPPAIYINGVSTTYSSSTLPSAYTRPAGNWSIGSTVAGGSYSPNIFDDFRIFGQVLTMEQIALLYHDRTSTAYVAPNPIAILAANKYRGKISASGSTTCGIKDDGSLWCWGASANGNIGNGTTGTDYAAPQRVIPVAASPENSFVQVSVGQYSSGSSDHACGIKADRSAMCWGADDYGQLGNGAGTTGDQPNPTVVSGAHLWMQMSVGAEHACGIDTAGVLWCWGRDNHGQLGNDGAGDQVVPDEVEEPGPWVSVAAGLANTCAIKTDGSLWCWGLQTYGVLGNGVAAAGDIHVPVAVTEQGPWVKVSRARDSICAIKLDGTLWCWGSPANGALGIGTGIVANQAYPRRVPDLGPWLDVEVGQDSAGGCGIKFDGTAWCWGDDTNDQLGNGASTATQYTPVRVLDPGPWSAITVGGDHGCGIKADGGAWCWGRDASGQLGNGAVTTTTQATAVRVENWPNIVPFTLNNAQTLLTKNTAATTISLNAVGGRVGFDGNSGGFGFTGSGRSILANPNGNSGLSIESTGAFDSQISWKTVTGADTRSLGVDNVTGNLEFGNNVAAVTNFMSAITPQMIINSAGSVGVGTATTPGAKMDITGGGLRVGNDTRTCTLSRKGVLRFSSGAMQFCNGVAWTGF